MQNQPRGWWFNFPLRTGYLVLDYLLLAVPVVFILDQVSSEPLLLFGVAALAIVPLAASLGTATEELSVHVGQRLGGLLNATLGNATELILGIFMVRAHQIDVVKASLSGSIIGNALLVFGMSAVFGGIRYGKQNIARRTAQLNSTMLFVAAAALLMPAIFSLSIFGTLKEHEYRVVLLSRWTSGVLILLYLLGLAQTLFGRRKEAKLPEATTVKDSLEKPVRSAWSAFSALAVTTVLLSFASEILVGQMQQAKHVLAVSDLFMGAVIIAIIGNVAEHASALMMAGRDRMEAVFAITVGSSVQIALLVAPILVFLSWAIQPSMSLLFSPLEIAGVGIAVVAVAMIAWDGETSWFEGAQLLAVYLIFALAIYWMPVNNAR